MSIPSRHRWTGRYAVVGTKDAGLTLILDEGRVVCSGFQEASLVFRRAQAESRLRDLRERNPEWSKDFHVVRVTVEPVEPRGRRR